MKEKTKGHTIKGAHNLEEIIAHHDNTHSTFYVATVINLKS